MLKKFEIQDIHLNNKTGKEFISIQFNRENNWIYVNWIGQLNEEDVIKGGTVVLDMIRRSHTSKILNDNRQLDGSWNGAGNYIESVWVPSATRLGVKYFAHVLSPQIYTAMAAQQMQKDVDGRFEMKLFKEMEEARTWLLNV